MAEKTREGFWAQLGLLYGEPPWSLYEVGLALLILAIGMFWIAPVSSTFFTSDPLNPTPEALMIGWSIGLAFAVGLVLVRWKRSEEYFSALRFVGESAHSRMPLLLLVMIGVAAALTINLIVAAGAEISNTEPNFSTTAILQTLGLGWQIQQLVAVFLLVGVVQPIAEGVIFFGVIQPRFRITFGAWPGLFVTALFYGGFHFLIYGTQSIINSPVWYGFIFPFLLGWVFAAIRVWMRSTRAVIAASIGVGWTSIMMMLALA